MSDAERRDRELDDFNKSFGDKLAKEIADHKSEWRQKFSLLFESKLREAKSCDERGDTFQAMEHKLLAEMINYFLKSLDT
jgi:hypothetical protein